MTVGDLLALLEGLDENTEVKFAHQPSWPFEYNITDVVQAENGTVYLVEGERQDYLQCDKSELGW